MPDYYNEIVANDRYMIGFTHPIEGWVRMWPKGATEGAFENSGWKFHLSVDKRDLAKAWNIVVEELLKDTSVNHFAKAIDPLSADAHADPNRSQAGKMMVIFTDPRVSPEHYQQQLDRIESRLKREGIRPGVPVRGDRQVPGGFFTFYRNENDGTSDYASAAKNAKITAERQYNPAKMADPYNNWKISHDVKTVPLWQVAVWPWHHNVTEGGTPISRVPTAGEPEVQEKIQALEGLGMRPIKHESRFMGSTVRIGAADMEQIDKARQELARVAQWPWMEATAEGDIPIMRIPVDNPAEVNSVMSALKSLGMNPLLLESASLGQTVRLTGEDMRGIKTEQQRQASLRPLSPSQAGNRGQQQGRISHRPRGPS